MEMQPIIASHRQRVLKRSNILHTGGSWWCWDSGTRAGKVMLRSTPRGRCLGDESSCLKRAKPPHPPQIRNLYTGGQPASHSGKGFKNKFDRVTLRASGKEWRPGATQLPKDHDLLGGRKTQTVFLRWPFPKSWAFIILVPPIPAKFKGKQNTFERGQRYWSMM